MLDIAIIGGGPAGLQAAINGVIRNKNVKVFSRNIETSYLYKAEKVDNYLGFLSMTGKDMLERFLDHAKNMEVEIQDSKVLEVFNMGDHYTLNVDNDFIEAKTIIIATGVSKSKALKGEDEYLGKGVSYCATCDGPLYREKDVVLIGDSKEAEEDVEYLSEICNKVYYKPKYKDCTIDKDNVEIINDIPQEVYGDDFVQGIKFKSIEIKASAVFFIKEVTPVNKLINGLELVDNSIKVDRYMKTNLEGIFAAGDCTGKPFQISKAVGEGAIASLEAIKYIHDKN